MNREEIEKIWKQKISGEKTDVELAGELGISVHSLYKYFIKHEFISTKTSIDEWKEYYETWKNKELTVNEIARELNVSLCTVYNNFKKFGYKIKKRIPIDKDLLRREFLDGVTYNELAKKYDKHPNYIRSILNDY